MKPLIMFKYLLSGPFQSPAPMYVIGDPTTPPDEMMAQAVDGLMGYVATFTGHEWPAFTDLGGYPLFYITRDNGVLCPACANENLLLTLSGEPDWRIAGVAVNYEDQVDCDHCSKNIPAAYYG